jgi:hypothetical protein
MGRVKDGRKKMNFKLSKPLQEAIKEMLRVMVLAIIPVLILQVTNNSYDFQAIAVVAVIAGLRFIDKLLHEIGKAKEGDSHLTKGLTRF